MNEKIHALTLSVTIFFILFSACSFSDGDIFDILYNNDGFYLATVSTGTSFVSPDGINWVYQSMPSTWVSNAVYSNGKIFATANNTPNNCLHYTYDLLNWQVAAGTVYPFEYVIYGNGVLITGDDSGNIRYSTDFLSESLTLQFAGSSGGNAIEGGTYANGVYIFVENGGIHTSRDGKNWNFYVDSIAASHSPHAVAYGDGKFVAVGNKTGKASILISISGNDWIDVSPGFNDELRDVTYGNGRFIAVGGVPAISSYCTVSFDGIAWSPKISLPQTGSNTLACIAYGNKVFLAGAEGNGIIILSEDGFTWSSSTGPGGAIGFTDILYIPRLN